MPTHKPTYEPPPQAAARGFPLVLVISLAHWLRVNADLLPAVIRETVKILWVSVCLFRTQKTHSKQFSQAKSVLLKWKLRKFNLHTNI